MKIYTDTPEGTTVIQNSFIDQYMPHANGEFVKVYLYLLRCANTGRELSLSSIADIFELTEKDIQRALAYWEKQRLMSLKLASDGMIVSATFTNPATAGTAYSFPKETDSYPGSYPSSARQDRSKAAPAGGSAQTVPSQNQQGPAKDEQALRQLFFIAEQYLQRPLNASEQNDFVYYYDPLHFSADLIEYLLEYCISKGSASRHYMRKVALAWAEAGITTVMQAKQETNLYNKNFFTIMNAFGIKGRNPAISEQETMSRWLNEYRFSIEIILEACSRTIRQTHQPNFQYADRILEQWHKKEVKSLADIQQLDIQRLKEQKKAAEKPQPKTANNRFNNFSQREYDYSQLEKQLLNQ